MGKGRPTQLSQPAPVLSVRIPRPLQRGRGPAPGVMPVAGAVVGTLTNWIALKWIFEPVRPGRDGGWRMGGGEASESKHTPRLHDLLL